MHCRAKHQQIHLKSVRTWTGKYPSTGLNRVRVTQAIYSDGRVSLIDDERPGMRVSKKSLFAVNRVRQMLEQASDKIVSWEPKSHRFQRHFH